MKKRNTPNRRAKADMKKGIIYSTHDLIQLTGYGNQAIWRAMDANIKSGDIKRTGIPYYYRYKKVTEKPIFRV